VLDRQVAHMVRQVDDLIDVSRISRGTIELRREPTDLGQVILHVRDALASSISSRQQTLTLSVPANPVYVEGDPTRLAQLVGNLIGNAAKFSDHRAEIQVMLGEEEGCAVLRIRDQGLGIPADQLERIFEMFTQLDRSLQRDRGGLGIGLSLVKTLVAQHGGSVKAWSACVGSGSEFTVRLPLLARVQEDAQPAAQSRPQRHRILVVDDNRDAADMLATLLEHAGHEVATAYDGFEALERASAFRPELVILDIGMPRLNGYDTARRMRERDRDVRLVALTGWGEDADRRRSTEAGFDAHLVKPVTPEQLEALLNGCGLQAPQAS
jgi:CheY-like chemotaxis protein/two-component sensor histidine kinase